MANSRVGVWATAAGAKYRDSATSLANKHLKSFGIQHNGEFLNTRPHGNIVGHRVNPATCFKQGWPLEICNNPKNLKFYAESVKRAQITSGTDCSETFVFLKTLHAISSGI